MDAVLLACLSAFLFGAMTVVLRYPLSRGLDAESGALLTIVPALACFDDPVWAKILPRALIRHADAAAATACPCRPQEVVAYAVAGVVALLSINPVANMFSRNQIMNTSFDPLHLVNTYGAFGTVGRERLNVVFEGTHADVPDETAEWKAYSYKGLPVDPGKMPPQVAPYQLRLDWQM